MTANHPSSRRPAAPPFTPANVARAWRVPAPRTPAAALLLGDQLLALSLPTSSRHAIDEQGRCHIVSRSGGVKPWLRAASPSIPYSTAMRYRRLAALLRRWLQLSPEIPLAWLFPSAPDPDSLAPSAPLRRETARARRAFAALLADSPSLARLQFRLETDLGLLAARGGDGAFSDY
ncbi:MAG: hypothetical protein J6Y19_09965, partial [Kiritimatiellae bacterium]|nr:hypothetical protein [Kiritimatiellia bacterium]